MVRLKLFLATIAISGFALPVLACPAGKVHTVITNTTVTRLPTGVIPSNPQLSTQRPKRPKTSLIKAISTATPTPALPITTRRAPPISSPTDVPSGGSNSSYMAIVDKWRAAMGLTSLKQDSRVESNALKTSENSGGSLKHKIFPGSSAQVMAPGNPDNFESVFVGGWLCEIPTLPGLGDACRTLSKGWNHAGQTGHAEILTSKQYSKIGCGLALGIWTCDLA
ncbi:cysteine-rich secretory protein family domain-containing protein [Pochonia chlamydosporia 170]|uniref:Cysteine-rich secretory protein family domain-containing protein n=1 Tax=Pochonia chlamydosporia 170 TaxID=1380566 RepID=A0A179F2A0_METCM|nr:cysteine-rich secretory protein family domain-containing protein [Pochonia chlamydosporia 170]OAQ59219.1 cysteine-rich secretory protein family domain-containing protein [Pochonia chlamydosporia 170]